MTMPCLKLQDYCSQCPWVLDRPLSTHASTRDFWTLTDKCGLVSCGVTAPFSWILMHRFCMCPSESLESLLCSIMTFYWLEIAFSPSGIKIYYMFVIHLYGYIILAGHILYYIYVIYLHDTFFWHGNFFCNLLLQNFNQDFVLH